MLSIKIIDIKYLKFRNLRMGNNKKGFKKVLQNQKKNIYIYIN